MELICPICEQPCTLLDVVDFNKSCAEGRGIFLELSGIPIYYAICSNCRFCFAPELTKWTPGQFKEQIYNDQYIAIDPEYRDARPRLCAEHLMAIFGEQADQIRHLDYGGGNGLLSRLLCEADWTSMSYDPHDRRSATLDGASRFDLITAFEVFEHASDIHQVMTELRGLLTPNGLIVFSTTLSDGNILEHRRLDWWYASPRNGHISLFSRHSLAILARRYKLNFASFTSDLHVFCGDIPPWATHILGST